MSDIATCAVCGEKAELCQSGRESGIKQPRICKPCLIRYMRGDEREPNPAYWMVQMGELGDTESIAAVRAAQEV